MLELISRLTEYPGNYAYYLVIGLSTAGALFFVFNQRTDQSSQTLRPVLGLAILLLAQFLFITAGAILANNPSQADALLPSLDRGLILFSLLWIIWLWTFPERSRSVDLAVLSLSVLIAAATTLNASIRWIRFDGSMFNNTLADVFWQIASLFLIILGVLFLRVRRPGNYRSGLSMLGLAFLGHGLHLLIRPEGNYSGIIRLLYIAAYPILLTLPRRITGLPGIPSSTPAELELTPVVRPRHGMQAAVQPVELNVDGKPIITERRRYSTDPKTFHAMLALAAETDFTGIRQAIPRAVAHAMLADLCFLVVFTGDKNQLEISAGYDLIREDKLEGGALNKNSIPMVANALQRGKPIRLQAGSPSVDIKELGELLGLPNPGHLLSVPMITPDKEILGGLLLLSPYSDRTWSVEDQGFLATIASALIPILQRNSKPGRFEPLSESTAALEHQNIQLNAEMEDLRKELALSDSKRNDFSTLLAAQDEMQRRIDQLQRENMELRSSPGPSSSSDRQLERELQSSLEEVARLKNQLVSQEEASDLRQTPTGEGKTGEKPEVIASLAQELRQPLSSVVGYTDLLLGESVGILGALQRKFVERIKTSIERINALIDDMIRVSTLDVEPVDLSNEPVDLNTIIDNAMSYTSGQVREKNISMHLDLPKKVAPIYADREALQQILIHLLQNAGAASPVEGSITLTVRTRLENGQDYILIQVADTGGGIPSEDLPRVFTRLYRADNILIQGVGDTGVGLSIAKTLTEAQNGRIWVESQMGAGSTFSVLLPYESTNVDQPATKKGYK